ncbi:MAG: M20/M25/M40 family metallo-hydrolase [Desulfobacteraceae bacterium]|jgi:succinyl-diaminopimelate desuccinylase
MHALREIVELTKALIRIPSVHSRPEEIRRCSEFIANWLTSQGIESQQTVLKGVPSIIAGPKSGASQVVLMTHFDVVEADNEGQFEPSENDGRLYGRGAIDDKYAVALSMVLFRNHLRRLQQSGAGQDDVCFSLLLTGDEEIGGHSGAAAALERLRVNYFIALDGGSPERVITKEKGVLQLKLTARGKAAHGARPWLGKNAFDELIADYRAIGKLFWESSPGHWHKTMTLSQCRAGDESFNKVPALATAVLDIRYTDKDDPEAILEDIRKAAASDVEVVVKEPLFVSQPSPYLEKLLAHTSASIGFEHGASDARFFSKRGIPGVVWGAEGEMSQHSTDEHLVIASLTPVYEGLDGFFKTIA